MTYSEPARTATRRIRIRWIRVAGLLVVIAAIAALSHEWRASSSSTDSSSSTAARPIHIPRRERPSPPRETGGAAPNGGLGAPGETGGATPNGGLGAPGETGGAVPNGRLGALGEADGAVPNGTTVLDNETPGVAKLDSDLLGALRRAAADAADGGVRFYLDSGWRSPEYQEQLLREAISKYGSEEAATRWVATPETSAHVSGDAVDIGPSSASAWLSEHGAEYGLCQIYGNEPWHYELRPEASDRGCPAMYADPTQDPRMQQ